MDDIYHRPLSSDEYILLYLKQFINETSICKNIIFIKKQDEKNEIYNYHNDRWENIIGNYFYLIDNHYNKFPYGIRRVSSNQTLSVTNPQTGKSGVVLNRFMNPSLSDDTEIHFDDVFFMFQCKINICRR